ncbi:MAG: ATPase, T2SS/T4P/T4SS family [Oscillospiraceae bacterium]|nr:ATPase, T2SS/T4P/T4SS family [Oscillospiraceae bacterium]
MKNIRIGEVLIEAGQLTEAQLQQALEAQKQAGDKRVGQILIEKGFVTEAQVLSALSQKLGYPLVDLNTYPVDTQAVGILPRPIAERYNLLAVGKKDGQLTVVMSDPLNFYAVEEARQISGMPLEIVLGTRAQIENAIRYHYADVETRSSVSSIEQSAAEPAAAQEIVEIDESDAGVVKLLNSMINQGFASGASDIHIEPQEMSTLVRMRLDGTILDYTTLPRTVHASLIARVKIISGLDIAERRLPQDGHFRTRIGGADVNVRVSVIPTVYGEKAVLRFLSNNNAIDYAGHFGMNDANYEKMQQILRSPYGIVYITGPTGSGKTTTLYMMLEEFTHRAYNISTIEDPVERNVERVNQMQVNNVSGLTFDTGLRALLRQDPDIIMVGETRDSETASISVRAAITGHLVLSTLHTNNAVSSIVRLEDMDVPPYLVSSAVVGIVAQRLVRKICPYCREEYVPDAADRALLPADIQKAYRGHGCNYCKNTGYKGRVAIHEILPIDRELRRMISAGETADTMTDYARKKLGMRSLRDEALALVRTGVTTVEELVKVAFATD